MRQIYYRKTDRKAILALLSIIAAVFSLLHFFGDKLGGQTAATPAADSTEVNGGFSVSASQGLQHGMTSDQTPWRTSGHDAVTDIPASEETYYNVGSHPSELFRFDPNTADSTQLLRLGLRPWQVRSIYRYRSRGGTYRRPEDFARLYGLTAGQYRRLKPYISISPDFLPASLLPEAAYGKPDTAAQPGKLRAGEHVVLNTADSVQLLRVPGIGSYFARRILAYGNRLGGYVTVDQLDEIEDFPTAAKPYFTISSPVTRRLSLNRLSALELRRHPYITFHQAKAITDYRRVHGPIGDLRDLQTLPDFPPEAITRLLPYVEY